MESAVLLPEGVESLDHLSLLVDRHVAASHLTLASFVVLAYEYLITLDQEVQYIWNSDTTFSLSKLAFVFVRYLPLLTDILRVYVVMSPVDHSACQLGMALTGALGIISVVCVDIILMLRIWALYGKSRKVFIILATLTILVTAFCLAIVGITLPSIPFLAPFPPPSVPWCTRNHGTQFFLLVIMMAVSELFIFCMLVQKALTFDDGFIRPPVITALLRHGAVYFCIVFLTAVFATIATLIPYLAQPVIVSQFTVTIACVTCVRLVFSLRGVELNRLGGDDDSDPKPNLGGAVLVGRVSLYEEVEDTDWHLTVGLSEHSHV